MYWFWLCWPLRNGQVLRRIALGISTSRDIYRSHVSLYASRNVLGGGLLMIDCWRWPIAHVFESLSGASQGNMTCALLGNYIWKLYIWEAQVVGSLAALGHLLMFRSSASRFTWYSWFQISFHILCHSKGSQQPWLHGGPVLFCKKYCCICVILYKSKKDI